MAQGYQGPPNYGPAGPQGYGYPQQPMQQPPQKSGGNVVIIIVAILGGVVLVVAILAVLAIGGTRRYLKSAKTSEAKNTLGAITRGAVAAYERERVDVGGTEPKHRLCGSSTPVPSDVPSGRKYQPSGVKGQDFETGDADNGWVCLKFTMASPMYYKYEYHAGSGYKGPARGGPDPGKDGFEVSAEGDLDANGKTSLFTQIGRVENGQIKLDPQIFIVDEYE